MEREREWVIYVHTLVANPRADLPFWIQSGHWRWIERWNNIAKVVI